MTELIGTASVSAYDVRALLRGAASAFDLRGNTTRQYHFAAGHVEADIDALREDWLMTGRDLSGAMGEGSPKSRR